MSVACLNVRGCGGSNISSSLKRAKISNMFVERRLDVLALNETKMRGTGECVGEFEFKGELGIVNGRRSGVTDVNANASKGVAILVSDECMKCVKEWKEISPRMMYVKMAVGSDVYVFMSVYGPGRECSVEERHDFWNDLCECINSFSSNEIVCVLGDLNARVGNQPLEGVIGNFGIEAVGMTDVNEAGEWLIRMCQMLGMSVCNTYFKKRDIHKHTFIVNHHGVIVGRALMDYVLLPRQVMGRVTDVNVCRGTNDISDHFLVVCKIKVKRGWNVNRSNVVRERVKTEQLVNDEECGNSFRVLLRQSWLNVRENVPGEVEEEWQTFKEAVREAAVNVCGMKRLSGRGIRKRSEWWNDEVRSAVEKKKREFERWLQVGTGVARERYKRVNRECRSVVRTAKAQANERWGAKVAEDFRQNKKMFWKEVNRVRKGEGKRSNAVKSEQGDLIHDSVNVVDRWKEYFKELLNVQDDRQANISVVGAMQLGALNSGVISEDEVRNALKKLKNGKAAGLDEMNAEYMKHGGVVVVEWLVRLFNVCYVQGVAPLDWKKACVVPLYKGKGDIQDCGSHRGISLLSTVGKIYGRILIDRVVTATTDSVGEEQSGFRQGRSCSDQTFIVRQICEKMRQKKKRVFFAFMDLEKAYDRVDRSALWQVMSLYGIGGNVLRGIKSMYEGSVACVRVDEKVSECFSVNVGLRQGCVMSPWLFNLYMDGVVREVYARVGNVGVRMTDAREVEWLISQLLFADDTALVAESEKELQKLVTEFGVVCERNRNRNRNMFIGHKLHTITLVTCERYKYKYTY